MQSPRKKEGEKPKDEKDEGNTFGKELKAARDKGEKTFVVSGKKYNVEDYDVKEEITEKFSDGMIDKLRKAYEPMKGKRIPPAPLMKIFDKIDSNKDALEQLYKADIPFVSTMAMSRLMLKHNYKADQINKLGKIRMEEFELDEASKEGTIKIIKTKDGKFQIQKMTKGKFVDIGKPHNSAKEAEKFRSGQPDLFGEEVELDEAVEDIFIKKGDVNQIAMRVARTARGLGLKAALKDGTVRIMGTKKKVSDFMRITIGKTSSGDASTVGKVSSQDDKLLDIQLTKEEVNEGTWAMPDSSKKLKGLIQVLKKPIPLGKGGDSAIDVIGNFIGDDELYDDLGDEGDKNPKGDARPFIMKAMKRLKITQKNAEVELGEKLNPNLLKRMDDDNLKSYYLAFARDPIKMAPQDREIFKALTPEIKKRKIKFSKSEQDLIKKAMKSAKNPNMYEEVELDEKYDLYHKDFSSAMQHAYDYAKKKMGITVDPKEIDSKVATGPKKPTEGKTNKYMLKGKGGNLQIQVYNKGGSKPFELNMYKEENQLISQAAKHITTNAIKGK